MTHAELKKLTLVRAIDLIRRKEMSSVELTESVLARIASMNARMNVFITVTAVLARDQARAGTPGPLHGAPIAVKDLFDTKGIRTTAGSRVFADRIPSKDSAVVKRLKEAGGVIVGKTNMHEFAYGVTNLNPHYGATRNPWDPNRISGGSSGGSAAAVALSMAFGAWGTDTGGSIRIPASLCGIVGFKPTYGLISTEGVIPLSSSLDHCGPLTWTVEDAALMLDMTMPGEEIRDLRIGIPRSHFFERVDPEVHSAVQMALRTLEQLGARMVEVDLPSAPLQKDVFPRIAGPEVYAYHRPFIERYRDLYGADVLTRIEAGGLVPPADTLDARRVQKTMKEECSRALKIADVIVSPTTPITAPLIEQSDVTWLDGSSELVPATLTRFTRFFNLVGTPAISVPCGFTSKGLPVGLQIAGREFDEHTILRVAAACEKESGRDCPRPSI